MFLGGDNRSRQQLCLMLRQYLKAHGGLAFGGDVHETKNARMGQPAYNGELTKVLVQSDKYATFGVGTCEDFRIARIFRPVACPDDVVTGRRQFRARPTPDA